MKIRISEDTASFLEEYDDKVILDEVQRVPSLFSYLQTKVDEDKRMGQYILSGSQNFKLLKSVQQSLSGRIALFKLFPFDLSELKSDNLLDDNPFTVLQKGFYPAIYDRDIPPSNYYSNYIETYVERDINEMLRASNHRTFRQFITLCAHAASQVLNLSDISKKCGISQPTAKAWISILESSYIIYLLPPYFKNFSKRIIKSPKLYFYDSGLLCHLLGRGTSSSIEGQEIKGHLFENMIVSEYVKQRAHNENHTQLYYWRDSNKNEVDLILEHNDQITLSEIKSTATIRQKLFKNLKEIASLFPSEVQKKLVYTGRKQHVRSDIQIVPWHEVFLDI